MRLGMLLGLALIQTVTLLLAPRIPQPPDYVAWADHRTWLGIPNAGDVLSNSGFLLVGLLGLWNLARGACRCDVPGERAAWSLFFLGMLYLALASSYFHWQPDPAGLALDRLGIAHSFVVLLAAVLIERVHAVAGKRLLPVLVVLGMAGVGHWYWSFLQGAEDLRLYILVQVLPATLLLASLLAFKPRYNRGGDYLTALLIYGLAVAADQLDQQILEWTGLLSGHAVKHLLTALAAYWLLRMLRRRQPV